MANRYLNFHTSILGYNKRILNFKITYKTLFQIIYHSKLYNNKVNLTNKINTKCNKKFMQSISMKYLISKR